MNKMQKEDLLQVSGLKFKVVHDLEMDYYLWNGSFGSGKMLVCWIADGVPVSIDYDIDQVLQFFNEGTWFES